MRFAQVVVNRPLRSRPPAGRDPQRGAAADSSTLTYRLPEHLREVAEVGQLVRVPLQASVTQGVIVDLTDEPPGLSVDAIRDVADILDLVPVVTRTQIELARWMASEYLEPLSRVMRLMLPPGLPECTSVVVCATGTDAQQGMSAEEVRAVRWLQRRGGKARLRTLLSAVGGQGETLVQSLEERGIIETHTEFVPPRPAPPRVQYVRLLADDRTVRSIIPRLGGPSKKAEVLLALAERIDAPMPLHELLERAGCTMTPVRELLAQGWIKITEPRTLVTAVPRPPAGATAELSRSPKRAAVLAVLQAKGSPMEWKELLERTGVSPATLGELERRNLVRRIAEPSLVFLTKPVDRVLDKVIELRGGQRERDVLEALRGATGPVWVGGLYAQTGADLSTLHRLAARGLVSLHTGEPDRPRPAQDNTVVLPDRAARTARMPQQAEDSRVPPAFEGATRLSAAQEAVWQQLRPGLRPLAGRDRPFVALMHGGGRRRRTEIYLHAVGAVLAAGQRALILSPEMLAMRQMVRRFEACFPGRVAVVHSEFSLGQRYAVWDRLRRGEAEVVIGPRSAVLVPVTRLGLIVIDEAHDELYKQDEPIPLPAYHACHVAVQLGRLTGAAVVLGSATPDVVAYFRATTGAYRLLELAPDAAAPTQRAPRGTGSLLASPHIRVVDLRQELRAGNRSIFSRELQQALGEALGVKEQAILFLNRRGAATFVLCRDCGYVARCPKCDAPLTLHRGKPAVSAGHRTAESWSEPGAGARSQGGSGPQAMVCHHCNYRGPAPVLCPDCGGSRIRHFGLGTERVEAEMRCLFPEARLVRWDRDTASGPGGERAMQAFVDRAADVLVATQMIAKGVDLPPVRLVGVVSADTALALPDYRAAERTFQLLTQVVSRARRNRGRGQVIIQTYHPEHHAIRAAAGQDYAAFYQEEIVQRRRLGYPPFGRLVALRYYDVDTRRCQAEAERIGRWLAAEIRRLGVAADLVGPAPCFFSRVRDRYRWQIVVRSTDPGALLGEVILPSGWRVDVDPVSLL